MPLTVGFAIVALLACCVICIWLSLSMSMMENAIARIPRASVNNYVLEVQMDEDLSQFSRIKHLHRIQRVKKMIVNRFATAGSCAFFRIGANVLTGIAVMGIANLLLAPLWLQLFSGLLFAFFVAFLAILIRPRVEAKIPALDMLLKYSSLHVLILAMLSLATANLQQVDKYARKELSASDDETLEKIQLEQGKAIIDRLIESHDFDVQISEMLRNVLRLSEKLTREIMVPRTDMVTIQRQYTLEDLQRLASRSGFSRIPVIGDDVDDVIGMAYLKDSVRATAYDSSALHNAVETIVRHPMIVPESKPVDDLFHDMQRTCQHVALVVDEYGGIAGLVTVEDCIEQIVGELEDEHDYMQHKEPEKITAHAWKMPSRTPIALMEEIFEVDIDVDDVDTVYGLLTKLLGCVPIVGSQASSHGLRFTAIDSAGRRKKIANIVVEPMEYHTYEYKPQKALQQQLQDEHTM